MANLALFQVCRKYKTKCFNKYHIFDEITNQQAHFIQMLFVFLAKQLANVRLWWVEGMESRAFAFRHNVSWNQCSICGGEHVERKKANVWQAKKRNGLESAPNPATVGVVLVCIRGLGGSAAHSARHRCGSNYNNLIDSFHRGDHGNQCNWMATLIDYILIPVDFWTIIHAHAFGIDMISSNSEYQNAINQSGHPIALVSMVTTLCETRLYWYSLEPRPSSPPDLRPSGRGPGKTSILFRVVTHYSG